MSAGTSLNVTLRMTVIAAALATSLAVPMGAQAEDGSPTPSEWPTTGEAAGSVAPGPAATVVPSEAPLFEGFDELILLSPESGGGTRPLLEWEEVEDQDLKS